MMISQLRFEDPLSKMRTRLKIRGSMCPQESTSNTPALLSKLMENNEKTMNVGKRKKKHLLSHAYCGCKGRDLAIYPSLVTLVSL